MTVGLAVEVVDGEDLCEGATARAHSHRPARSPLTGPSRHPGTVCSKPVPPYVVDTVTAVAETANRSLMVRGSRGPGQVRSGPTSRAAVMSRVPTRTGNTARPPCRRGLVDGALDGAAAGQPAARLLSAAQPGRGIPGRGRRPVPGPASGCLSSGTSRRSSACAERPSRPLESGAVSRPPCRNPPRCAARERSAAIAGHRGPPRVHDEILGTAVGCNQTYDSSSATAFSAELGVGRVEGGDVVELAVENRGHGGDELRPR
ncbi:hypothetical protein ACFPM0_06145 [Pseudonocardia sulfidoxydans]|uniref:hypothetical protein n=1 Tax=Pseudonocardia sulfidoxydans TaxID=54011 RepID=UPI0036165B7D